MLKKIFSVRNQGIHKVITILGVKLKIKSKKLMKRQGLTSISFFEKIFSVKNKSNHKVIKLCGIKIKVCNQSHQKIRFPKGTRECIFNKNKKNIKKLAIFASFSCDGKIHDYVVYSLKELYKRYEGIIFIADNPIFPEELDKIKDYIIYAECKRHQEYDFGSYKKGYLYAYSNQLLDNVEELLLCNDSVYGPIYPLENVYTQMDKEECDFWGMIESPDNTYHLQSWFLVFKSKIINSGLLGKFLNKVKKEKDFWDVVNNYEMTLTKFLLEKGFKNSAYIKFHNNKLAKNLYKSGINNIAINSAYNLIKQLNFPFIKIKFFINPPEHQIFNDRNDALNFIKDKNEKL